MQSALSIVVRRETSWKKALTRVRSVQKSRWRRIKAETQLTSRVEANLGTSLMPPTSPMDEASLSTTQEASASPKSQPIYESNELESSLQNVGRVEKLQTVSQKMAELNEHKSKLLSSQKTLLENQDK